MPPASSAQFSPAVGQALAGLPLYLVILLFQISGGSRLPETTSPIHSFRSDKALAATTQAIVGPIALLQTLLAGGRRLLDAPGISSPSPPRTTASLRLRTAASTPFIATLECGDRFDLVHIGQD